MESPSQPSSGRRPPETFTHLLTRARAEGRPTDHGVRRHEKRVAGASTVAGVPRLIISGPGAFPSAEEEHRAAWRKADAARPSHS